MSRNKMKIKRYGANIVMPHRGWGIFLRILGILVIAGAVFFIGWKVADRSIDSFTGFWYDHFSVRKQKEDTSQQPESEGIPESVPEDEGTKETEHAEETPAPQPIAETQTSGVWGEVALSAADSEEKLTAALRTLKEGGADHALLTLKDERGYLYYSSAVPLAATAGAVRAETDVSLYVRLCRQEGLTPCVRLVAFRDPAAAYADRDSAVCYQHEGMLWLDNAAELGGKPWLNPYKAAARQYILDLANELHGVGVEDIVFSGVQFPDAYALEVCYYGESADQISRTDCLRECVALLQGTLEEAGVRCWFEWPTTYAIGEVDPLILGDGAAALGALRILLDLQTVGDALAAVPSFEPSQLTAFAVAARTNGTCYLGLATRQLAYDPSLAQQWQQQAAAAGFTHFEN